MWHLNFLRSLFERVWRVKTNRQKKRQAWLNFDFITATAEGDTRKVEQYLSQGADVEAEHCNGWTALQFAVFHNQIEIVDLLLKNGANKEVTDFCENTVLHFAAKEGHYDVVKLLLEAGIDRSDKNLFSQTALDQAVSSNVIMFDHQTHSKIIFLLKSSYQQQFLEEKQLELMIGDSHDDNISLVF